MSPIVLGPPAWLTFICENDNCTTTYKGKLHEPIENTGKITRNVNCQRVTYSDEFGHRFGNFLGYFYVQKSKKK